MTTFGQGDSLRGARFTGADLTGARFVACDFVDVVLRGSEVQGTEIDSPWLLEGENVLIVNGVNVLPYVDAELNRRFPGREQRRATDPAGLRAAWAALEQTWAATVNRAAGMPADTVDVSVADEWSFAQTLRHLVMATDTWFGKAVMQRPQPYHPVGQPDSSWQADGKDPAVFSADAPSYAEVLDVRAGRQTMVREFLIAVTDEELGEERRNPHAPQYPETVLSCLHTILEEEWEHHRYAVRDLDAIASGAAS